MNGLKFSPILPDPIMTPDVPYDSCSQPSESFDHPIGHPVPRQPSLMINIAEKPQIMSGPAVKVCPKAEIETKARHQKSCSSRYSHKHYPEKDISWAFKVISAGLLTSHGKLCFLTAYTGNAGKSSLQGRKGPIRGPKTAGFNSNVQPVPLCLTAKSHKNTLAI